MAMLDSTLAKGRAVGALACQSNSYQTTLETEVVSCVQAPKLEQNGSKNKQQQRKTSDEDEWLIECADSVFFPEGGGQPCDHGTLTLLTSAEQKPIPIRNVQRQGLRCTMYSPEPFAPGVKVRQEIDWKRRWDHMQQHTGQHLLSAIMESYCPELETLGWGMGSEGSMNYVDVQRKPTDEELDKIQGLCTQAIQDDHKIWLETPGNAKDDSLPEDYDKTEGVVRVIHIGNLDANSCCGTHLAQTSHIGLVVFGSSQPIHVKNCRLQFMTGDRAINLATASVNAIGTLAKLTSSKLAPAEVVAKVKEMSEAGMESRRTEKKLLLEIAKYESERAKAVIQTGKDALVYRPDGGIDFINKVIGEVKDTVAGTGLVIVAATGQAKSAGSVVITGDKEAVDVVADKVKSVLPSIKGHGNGGKWQGKVSEWQKVELKQFKALFAQ